MNIDKKILSLKKKLVNQITNNENYDILCKTSIEIDRLIVEYYKKYGLNGAK